MGPEVKKGSPIVYISEECDISGHAQILSETGGWGRGFIKAQWNADGPDLEFFYQRAQVKRWFCHRSQFVNLVVHWAGDIEFGRFEAALKPRFRLNSLSPSYMHSVL